MHFLPPVCNGFGRRFTDGWAEWEREISLLIRRHRLNPRARINHRRSRRMMESLEIPSGTRCLYYSTLIWFVYLFFLYAQWALAPSICHFPYFVLKCGSFISCNYDIIYEPLVHVNHHKSNTSLMLKCTFQYEKEGTANWNRKGQDNLWALIFNVTIMDILLFLFVFSPPVFKIFTYSQCVHLFFFFFK